MNNARCKFDGCRLPVENMKYMVCSMHNALRLHGPKGKRPRIEKKTEGEKKYVKAYKALDKNSVPYLVKNLDAIFSKYIRLKYADSAGLVQCYTTGKYYHWTKIQAGHFFSRRYYAIRWNENNVRPQGISANIFNQGEQSKFKENLIKEIGHERVDELEFKKNNRFNLDRFVLISLIKEYTLRVSGLKDKL